MGKKYVGCSEQCVLVNKKAHVMLWSASVHLVPQRLAELWAEGGWFAQRPGAGLCVRLGCFLVAWLLIWYVASGFHPTLYISDPAST